MSPRVLKTKFPCRHCGAPAEVERLRDERYATCEPCSERQSAKNSAGWADESARRAAAEAMESETDQELVRRWLLAAAKRLEAAARMVAAVPLLTPAERRLYLRSAASRARWASSILKQLPPHFAALIDDESHGFAIIDGGGELPEVAPPMTIRLLGRGDEP